MLLFFSVLGVFLSSILIYFNARNNKTTLYLGLFFFFLSLYSLFQYILLYSKSVQLISLFLFNIAIVSSPLYLIGPMLYWYFRSVLTDDSRLMRKDLWHLLPMIIYFIAALPHSFVPWNEKVEVARTLVQNPEFMQSYRATLLSWILPAEVEYLSRPLLVLGYTLWSAGLFINYLLKAKATSVFSRQQFMKKWLFIFLGFLLVLEITQILQISRGFKLDFSEFYFHFNVIRLISVSGLIGLLVTPFFFPSILYGMPRLPVPEPEPAKEGKTENLLTENISKTQLRLENSYLNSIGHKVDSYMTESKPYLQPELNLSQVSVQTSVPIHHLGYYFKEVKKKPFHDYRNEWRVDHAKKLIAEGKINQMTLEAIGLSSGFSNRNAFRIAFQRVEGVTPADYSSSYSN